MKNKFSGTIAIAWGRNGGLGFYRGFMTRLCLWRIAIYYIPEEIEDTFKRLIDQADDINPQTPTQ